MHTTVMRKNHLMIWMKGSVVFLSDMEHWLDLITPPQVEDEDAEQEETVEIITDSWSRQLQNTHTHTHTPLSIPYFQGRRQRGMPSHPVSAQPLHT